MDPLVSLMMVEKVPDSTYEMVGGLDKQIKEIKEVLNLLYLYICVRKYRVSLMNRVKDIHIFDMFCIHTCLFQRIDCTWHLSGREKIEILEDFIGRDLIFHLVWLFFV